MIELVIPARDRSIGSMDVKRILPYSKRRSIGPFVFVDQMGPLELVTDGSMDVLAHPHIGLATVTYLFDGRMMHRDSLGTVQLIEPGEVNWMNAGRGIVHSERSSDAGNAAGGELFGVQTWVAIPENKETGDPSFEHHGAADLPETDADGVYFRVIMGELHGSVSPVNNWLEPLYAECRLAAGSTLELPRNVEERAVYILSGTVEIDGTEYSAGSLPVFSQGSHAEVHSREDCRLMVIGGPRLERPRYMWWNFVATSNDLIEQARSDWKQGNFDAIPNETGFVPLPEGNFPKPQPM